MIPDQAIALMSRITYKDNVSLELILEEWPGPAIVIRATEWDATGRRPGFITIQSRHPFTPLEHIHSEREFLQHIRNILRSREQHELDEWLKLDGVAPFYPHKEDTNLG